MRYVAAVVLAVTMAGLEGLETGREVSTTAIVALVLAFLAFTEPMRDD